MSKNEGVAGYVEAFWHVLSESQTAHMYQLLIIQCTSFENILHFSCYTLLIILVFPVSAKTTSNITYIIHFLIWRLIVLELTPNAIAIFSVLILLSLRIMSTI